MSSGHASDPASPGSASSPRADGPILPAQGPVPSPKLVPPLALVALALAAGLVAGVASYVIGESTFEHFKAASVTSDFRGVSISMPSVETQAMADIQNAILTYAAMATALALALGVAGGLARHSARAGLIGAAVGIVLGLLAAVGLSYGVLPPFLRTTTKANTDDLLLPLLVLGSIWGAIGAAGGLAFGVGLGGKDRILRATFGGLVGGLLGCFLFELVGAAVFPLDGATEPLSKSPASRLVARFSVTLLVALCTVIAVQVSGQKPRKASVARA